MIQLTKEEYDQLQNDNAGICLACDELSSSGVASDAECKECDSCGEDEVYGVKQALLLGEIEII